jgi:pterin-4a-carbinolamine dehydratase
LDACKACRHFADTPMWKEKHPMTQKSPVPAPCSKSRPLSRLKAERIQIALLSLPGWSLGPPRQRVECNFRLPSASETDQFVPFVVETCRDEKTPVVIAVRENLVVVRLGGARGVTEADLTVAKTLNASRWTKSAAAALV